MSLARSFSDALFADLFPNAGQPAYSPTCIALILVLQTQAGRFCCKKRRRSDREEFRVCGGQQPID
jgi:hypothetical protein